MTASTAKIFMHGRSQAVRLPKEFRLPGKECRVRREGKAVILEPMAEIDVKTWRAELDQLVKLHGEFLPDFDPVDPPVAPEEFDWDGVAGANDDKSGPKP